jgi:hypothetical protein
VLRRKETYLALPGNEVIKRYPETLDYTTETLRHNPQTPEKKGEMIASTPACSAYAYGKHHPL